MLYDLVRPYKTVCLAGMCKNAGKTTALNALIKGAAKAGDVLGLTSIGRDGEQIDLVTGTGKPPIEVPAGTLFAAAAGLLPFCTVTKELLAFTGDHTPLGEVLLCRALSAGSLEIGGPSHTARLKCLQDSFFACGAKRVFIDGALFRKSLCAPEICEGAVLSTGASYGPDMDKTVADTLYAAMLLTLPKTDGWQGAVSSCGRTGEGEAFPVASLAEALSRGAAEAYLAGAVTDRALTPLLNSRLKDFSLTVQDGTKLFLSPALWEKLAGRGVRFFVKQRNALLAITANPYSANGPSYDKNAFIDALRSKAAAPVVDALAEQEEL